MLLMHCSRGCVCLPCCWCIIGLRTSRLVSLSLQASVHQQMPNSFLLTNLVTWCSQERQSWLAGLAGVRYNTCRTAWGVVQVMQYLTLMYGMGRIRMKHCLVFCKLRAFCTESCD
ncbi:hypothetical protein COO60DRAFT_1481127 [Scenedesmus sp. NREL 46B-D3]|nr:hypothetical protein COO60DRAFT_1481127 [Scenedesmus sp. NREL 46B-D3]